MKITILYSSGLDSFILKSLADSKNYEVKCIYYAHGAESEAKELALLPDFVEVRKIDWLSETNKPVAKTDDTFAGNIYIPGRNLILCALAACQEMPDEVWMGTMWDEDNEKGTDKNEIFRHRTSELLSYVLSPFTKSVKIVFPFVELGWTKYDAVKWALNNNISSQTLINTVSCWHHDGTLPCGECKQCFKRNLVFRLNGFSETYKSDPSYNEYGKNLANKYLSEYDECNKDEQTVVNMLVRLNNIKLHGDHYG